ncbi:MAG: glycoside hydrolase family 32 protein, partial [Bacteroidota bacterium]
QLPDRSPSTEVKGDKPNPLMELATWKEPYRPQFHFTPPAKWMNDPNGMVYYDGEYHLFYQHYPEGDVWGPMHWGHAVSEDLVHWKHLPIGLEPDKLGMIFSGSAVVDWNNSAGFQTGDEKTLVAIFTHHLMEGEKAGRDDFQYQSLAYSNDRGRTWTKYSHNPVLDNPGIKDFRDPKVFWHEASNSWIMSLAVKDRIHFYRSNDLKEWTFASEFGGNAGAHGGVWECPDLFPLPVDGDQANQKWVLLVSINPGGPNGGSATQYFIGDFDGTTFTNDNDPSTTLWLDHGTDNYAGVTWSDLPENNQRRIFIGWMSNWDYARDVPTKPWRSAMTIPRTLELKKTKQGVRLRAMPIDGLRRLRKETYGIRPQTLEEEIDLKAINGIDDTAFEIHLEFEYSDDAYFGLIFKNAKNEKVEIAYVGTANEWIINRSKTSKSDFHEKFPAVHRAPNIQSGDTLKMTLYLDNSSVELFANDGLVCMTDLFFSKEELRRLSLFKSAGNVRLVNGTVYTLKSIHR